MLVWKWKPLIISSWILLLDNSDPDECKGHLMHSKWQLKTQMLITKHLHLKQTVCHDMKWCYGCFRAKCFKSRTLAKSCGGFVFLRACVCNPGFIIPVSCCRHCNAARDGHTSSSLAPNHLGLCPLLLLFPLTVTKSVKKALQGKGRFGQMTSGR